MISVNEVVKTVITEQPSTASRIMAIDFALQHFKNNKVQMDLESVLEAAEHIHSFMKRP